MAADAYQEWCRDAMLPRALGYGELRQGWYRQPGGGWECNEPAQWLPVRREAQLPMPMEYDGFRVVWVPDERAWLDWLTTASYNVVASSRPRAERHPVSLVPEDGLTVYATGAVSWAHGMALCWAQTPDGLKHFRALEAANSAEVGR
jgi:hypothetical protein